MVVGTLCDRFHLTAAVGSRKYKRESINEFVMRVKVTVGRRYLTGV